MIEKGLVIALDGLTASGKSSVAEKLKRKYKDIVHVEMSELYKEVGKWWILLKEQGFSKSDILDFVSKYIKFTYKIEKQEVKYISNLPTPVLTMSSFYIKNQLYKIIQNDEVQKKLYKVLRKIINELKENYTVVLTGRMLSEVYPDLDYHFCLKADEETRIARIMERDGVSEEEARTRRIEEKIYHFDSNVISINSERLSTKEMIRLIENVIVTKNRTDKIIKVHFLGTTSTGKSTMCRYCAQKYHEPYSTEYIRDYMEEHGMGAEDLNDMSYELWYKIAKTQLQKEKRAEKLSNKFFFADSGAIAIGLDWHFMDRPEMAELVDKQLNEAEVIFVCDNNIEFEDDGMRPGSPARSKKLQVNMIKLLNEKNVPYIMLSGSIEERFKTVQQVLNKFNK